MESSFSKDQKLDLEHNQGQIYPLHLGVHCVAHRTNLAMQPFKKLALVSKIKMLV
jgi:hypothetical protein